jgi:hypothetical protein
MHATTPPTVPFYQPFSCNAQAAITANRAALYNLEGVVLENKTRA